MQKRAQALNDFNLRPREYTRNETSPGSWPRTQPYRPTHFRSERDLQKNNTNETMEGAREKMCRWYREFRPTKTEIDQRPKKTARRRLQVPTTDRIMRSTRDMRIKTHKQKVAHRISKLSWREVTANHLLQVDEKM